MNEKVFENWAGQRAVVYINRSGRYSFSLFLQKALKKKNKETRKLAVYEILNWLEKQGELHVKGFWRSVFQDHILEKYAVLRSLQTKFMDGQSCHSFSLFLC